MNQVFNTYKVTIDEAGSDFYRHVYGSLMPYGVNQKKLYGAKENLIARLEQRYKFTLGKTVRSFDGDIILFFPTNIGMTGKLASIEWDIFSVDIRPAAGLISMVPADSIPAGYERFCRSLGFDGDGQLLPDAQPLYVYHHFACYKARSVNPVGLISFELVDPPIRKVAQVPNRVAPASFDFDAFI